MTPPVSGGVPEQGLREPSVALTRSRIDHWLRNRGLQFEAYGFGATVDAIMALMEMLAEYEAEGRAALERPRPALPAPEPHLEREGNHIRGVGFGSGPLAPDFIPSHLSKAGAALPPQTGNPAREALECAEYALSHPSSDQQFALNAVRDALNAVAGSGAETPPQPEIPQ